MSTVIHMSLDIAGVMRDPDTLRILAKSATRDDGKPFENVTQLKQALQMELDKGRRVLPMSDECEGFDYQTGCPGHEVPHAI